MKKIKLRFNMMLVAVLVAVLAADFSCLGTVYAFGDYVPIVQTSTTPEEIKRKIDSMTNSPKEEPVVPISPTYSPVDDMNAGQENVSDALDTKETSDQNLQSYGKAKSYISPVKVLFMLFLVDLILLTAYFLYLYAKPGRKS